MRKVLLVDDEPHNIEWIRDFVIYLEGDPTIVPNEESACKYLRENSDCRLLIVDMRIGKTSAEPSSVTMQGANREWGGLYIINFARSDLGRKSSDLHIATYTVVDDKDLDTRLQSLNAKYFRKGDIKKLKEFIKDSLS